MIIGISGKARSGKDTFANMLMQELSTDDGPYEIMAYSDALKERVRKDFNLTINQVYGDLKEVPDKRYPKKYGGYWAPREILQHMGTEGFRYIEPTFWVRKLFERIGDRSNQNVIVTDCRFPDEVDAIIDHGGVHIRVERKNKDYATNMQHASETSLDGENVLIHFTIENDGSIEELGGSAYVVAEKIRDNNELKNEIGGN